MSTNILIECEGVIVGTARNLWRDNNLFFSDIIRFDICRLKHVFKANFAFPYSQINPITIRVFNSYIIGSPSTDTVFDNLWFEKVPCQYNAEDVVVIGGPPEFKSIVMRKAQ